MSNVKRNSDMMMGSFDGDLDSAPTNSHHHPHHVIVKPSSSMGKFLLLRNDNARLNLTGPQLPHSHHYYTLSQEKEQQLRDLYTKLDMNKDGSIDIKELTHAFQEHIPHVPSKYAKDFLRRADKSKSHNIDFKEFVHYILEHEKKLEVVFKDLDKNQDGHIDRIEVKNYFHSLGVPVSDSEADNVVAKISTDGTATINLDEFQKFLLFFPSSDPREIAKFWRHNLVIDIGEDTVIPEDFTESEIQTGIWWRHLLAGAVAGAISRTATAPLDRIKIFLQVNANRENGLGVVNGLRFLLREGGAKSLWRGNGVNVVKIAPESAIKFMAYEQFKRLIKWHTNEELSVLQRFAAGSLAGASAQTCIYPMEVLKTRLALRKSGELSRGLWHAVVTMYRRDGARVFYRGYLPNCVGIIPYAGTDLAIYETLKRYYMQRQTATDKEPGILVLLACGTASSTLGQLSSYPLALVRTRLQARGASLAHTAEPAGMLGQFRHIYTHDGLFGLYRGLVPNFLKVLPAVGISYVTYELVRKQLGVQMT